MKDISEYESKFNGGDFFDRKCELEQLKQKNQSEIEIIESHLINKQIEALKSSIESEQTKLSELTNSK